MSEPLHLTGIHHLTAVTADAPGNVKFYTQSLGLRLVKKTVNQDDTSSYHLFYADGVGSPGTDVTFFDWPASPERRGGRSVVRTGLRIPTASVGYWVDRLTTVGRSPAVIPGRGGQAGRTVIDFEDPEGQRLSLVADSSSGASHSWAQSPVPAEHQIRGLGPITICVPDLTPTEDVLTGVMNMTKTGGYDSTHVFSMNGGEAGPAAELHVTVDKAMPPQRLGAGGVHHVAFRVPDDQQYEQWRHRLDEAGLRNGGPVDRFYFKSLYFREPGGVLFELATDGPGFSADEPVESLGQRLSLPPFLEGKRAAIEAGLKPL